MLTRTSIIALVVLGSFHGQTVHGEDWPMWRFDAQRRAASPQQLPSKLHLHWTRDFPSLQPAWPDQAKMQFDVAYEPIVVGKTLYIASSLHDCVTALDVTTGQEKWRFFADGPVRFAPAVWEGRLYFTSDDGYLYSLEATTGQLLWKFRGGPSDRKILGNERLISSWPARGAPVIAEGTVYFAASIWPFMGIFIHAVDARTGEVRWTNDGDGCLYMKQPHQTDSFASVAPQGPLVVTRDKLLVPGGRSVPACFDRQTGKFLRYQLAENGKRGGGFEVAATDQFFFNGGAVFDLQTAKWLANFSKQVVLAGDRVYAVKGGALRAYDLTTAGPRHVPTDESKGSVRTAASWGLAEVACFTLPESDQPAEVDALIKAGPRLYAALGNQVLAIDFQAKEPTLVWQTTVEGHVMRLVAAADRLLAVTLDGRLYCFGSPTTATHHHPLPHKTLPARNGAAAMAQRILKNTRVHDGYAIVWGLGHGNLITELAQHSNLRLIGIDPDAQKVQNVRDTLTEAGLYGTRVSVHMGNPDTFTPPPYLASLVVCPDLSAAGLHSSPDTIAKVFQSLRPFGGVAYWPESVSGKELAKAVGEANLVGAEVHEGIGFTLLRRVGPVPDSANWTHENGDASNTRVSRDKLVKAPLGLLWFGGPSHEGILPRHGHGPQPQVIDGRLIIEGIDLMRAIDIYTGRLLWETPLPGVGRFFNNLAHQPGANASGGNYVSTPDGIYVVLGPNCIRLNPETGKKVGIFSLPAVGSQKEPPLWGYLNVSADYLIGGADPLFDPKTMPAAKEPGEEDPAKEKPLGSLNKVLKFLKNSRNDNFSASKHLVVMDRHSGKVLWTAAARHGFRHNGICVGGRRLYAIDRLSGAQLSQLQQRGEEPAPARLLAFDLQTGKEIWSTDQEIFGTWLSYSTKHDVLVEAGRVARDSMADEPKGMRAYKANNGEVLWYQPTYLGPAMIHGDAILQDQGGCDLLTGTVKMRSDPLTGQLVPWRWVRNYGCNTPAASEHLLTFRSGAAGFYDLCHDGGTGNIGGFRSSCTNNLIVAGGVLSAPEYTRTCTCSYQNQTSLALIHMPEAEMWTFFGSRDVKGPIRRVGINFGAPGDRRAADGTLWLECPSVAGYSPTVTVKTTPSTPPLFRRHASRVVGPHTWVAASGAKGLTAVTIDLRKDEPGTQKYTVRLVFLEPDKVLPGQRLFSVALQEREVLHNLDIVKEAGGSHRALVKEFRGIVVEEDLTIRLTPAVTAAVAESILCGIEVVAEEHK